jgi:hypothetical protein
VLTLQQIQRHMRRGIVREMIEESTILPREISNFHMLPLAYIQDWPECELPGAQFMYQFWEGTITSKTMREAQRRLHDLAASDWKEILPADVCEKDAIEWWDPAEGFRKIRSGFSQKMTRMYAEYVGHGI